MGTKKYKPTTPGQRSRQINDYEAITTTKKEKSLLKTYSKKAGRNNSGKITVRHRGGGNKRFYREIDFSRKKKDIPGKIVSIEYDTPFLRISKSEISKLGLSSRAIFNIFNR